MERNDRMAVLIDIIEVFEDFLDRKGIVIPNDEKDDDPGASNIYGTDFGALSEDIEQSLIWYGLLDEEGEAEC